jgi:hypothetical protein
MVSAEEKLHKTVADILDEVKQEAWATPDDEWIKISTHNDERWRAVRYLAKLGAIKAIEYTPLGSPLKIIQEMNGRVYKPNAYKVEMLQPKFDEIYKQYHPEEEKLITNKLPYKKDGLFHALWKYTNANRLTGKSLITFFDLLPLEKNDRFTIFEFINALKALGIELENITFHTDIHKKYSLPEHELLNEYFTKNPSKNFSKALKKLFENKATFTDIYNIFGNFDELFKAKLQLSGLLEFIEFSPKPSYKNIAPLKNAIDQYLQSFIDDKLYSPELKNFYRFSKQKEIFIRNIEQYIQNYGDNFLFKQGKAVSVGNTLKLDGDDEYLFIHTLAAMEKLDFLEIESILIMDMDTPPEKQSDDYKIKLSVTQRLLDEYKRHTIHIPADTDKSKVETAHKLTNDKDDNPKSNNKPTKNKLNFFPETGDIEFGNETATVANGNKDFALLSFLDDNKNTSFTVKDIQEFCNPSVNKVAHQFKGEKDIDDTIRQIRFKLKIKKGAYFPIMKKGEKDNKKWIWIEK